MASKSKKKASRTKLKSYKIAYLGHKPGRFTPEQALKWMKVSYPGYAELVSTGARCAKSGALEAVGWELQMMVEAMTEAIESGRPVRVERDEGAGYSGAALVLRFASIAALAADCELSLTANTALREMLDAMAESVERQCSKELDQHMKRRDEERARCEPNRVSEQLFERMAAVETECDEFMESGQQILSGAIDEALRPIREKYERQIAAYTHEVNVLGAKVFNYKAAGEPPEDYEPSELAELAIEAAGSPW